MQGNIGERDSQDSAGEPNGAESGPRADGFVARVDARSGGRGLRPHGRVTPRRVLGARTIVALAVRCGAGPDADRVRSRAAAPHAAARARGAGLAIRIRHGVEMCSGVRGR